MDGMDSSIFYTGIEVRLYQISLLYQYSVGKRIVFLWKRFVLPHS